MHRLETIFLQAIFDFQVDLWMPILWDSSINLNGLNLFTPHLVLQMILGQYFGRLQCHDGIVLQLS